jgi:hypothetical protein
MTEGVRKTVRLWLEAGRKIGFFLLLVAGSAAIGLIIAWPLWLFATTQREAYTIFALCCAVGGIVTAIVRAIVRNRKATRDPGRPGRTLLSVILAIVLVLVAVSGSYTGAVLLYRGLWNLAIPTLLVWVGLLWLLARARRALKPRKERPVPAENNSE